MKENNYIEDFYNSKYDISLPTKDLTTAKKTNIVLKYIKAKSRILILGCGPCFEGKIFKNAGHYVVCADINQKFISQAKKICDEAYFCNVMENFPFKDNSFDVIVAFELIEHLAFVDSFLKECYRVLRKGGNIILSTPSLSYWRNRLSLLLGKDILSDEHPRMFTPKSLSAKVNNNNFRNIKMKGIGKLGFLLSFSFPLSSLCGDFIVVAEKT